jgi:hypothetical protein
MSILDAPGLSKKTADERYARPLWPYEIEIPVGLGWDTTNFPIEIVVVDSYGLAPQHGDVNFTPEELFGLKSTALSSPFAIFYVATTGSDANVGSQASPVRSIGKAQALANATGQPCKVIVNTGTYARTNNPRFNSGTAVVPAVDTAFVASGGRVTTGTFDNYAAPSLDATFTNCYKLTGLGACDRIVNRLEFDDWGELAPLRNVATPTLCNSTPDSWAISGTDVYINRADRAVVTNANTRAYRSASATYAMAGQVNVYFGGEDGESGWDLEGSNTNAVVDFLIATPSTTVGCSVFSNVKFSQAGGVVNTSARSISCNGFNGLIALFNCHGGGAQTDAYNVHNNYGATKVMFLTVNCSSYNTGRPGNQSCNAFTLHEDCIAIDVCGNFQNAHGGTVRNINTSRCLLAGTFVKNDRGDAVLGGGGSYQPAAIVVNDTAQIWADSVKIDMPAGTRAYATNLAAGATIRRRDCFPVGQPDAGGGTFENY